MLNFTQLTAIIAELQAAEKVTKEKLSQLSRELLSYAIASEDVRPINMLLGANEQGYVLTPVNWRITCQYMAHFLPFKSNFNDVRDCIVNGGKREPLVFLKKDKAKFEDKAKVIEQWLATEINDVWVWQKDNVKIEAKPVDYAARLTSAINSAIDEEKGSLTVAEVFQAILDSDINTDDLLLAAMQDNQREAA